jgi:hypothetical protein
MTRKMQLELEEFEFGGSRYIRCKNEDQRHLLSHLLNGARSCFFAEELDKVLSLASAHGWVTCTHSLPNKRCEELLADPIHHDT